MVTLIEKGDVFQLRACAKRFDLERLLPLVTENTARVLKLDNQGKLEPGMLANVLVLDRKTLALKEVIARGRRLLKGGEMVATEAFLEDSIRSIQLTGKKAPD